jgi:hypothetical protein
MLETKSIITHENFRRPCLFDKIRLCYDTLGRPTSTRCVPNEFIPANTGDIAFLCDIVLLTFAFHWVRTPPEDIF